MCLRLPRTLRTSSFASHTTSLALRSVPRSARPRPPPSQIVRRVSAKSYGSRSHPRHSFKVRSAASVTFRSSNSIFTVIIAVGITLGAAYFWQYPPGAKGISPTSQLLEPEDIASTLHEVHGFELALGMPGQILPGRPGNLTAEQEGKLREFWGATLKVFGVLDSPPAVGETPSSTTNGTATPRSVATDTTETTESSKKRKHRLGLFRRKKGDMDIDTDSTTGSGSVTPSDMSVGAPEDDKHGETKAFREAIASSEPEDLRKAFWNMTKHDHPDALLLRFLRARKWDVNAALVMLISTMHWRAQEMHVDDDIIRRGEEGLWDASKGSNPAEKKEGEDFLAQLRMGKSFLHGVDKEGRPMCIVRVRLHRKGEQSEASLERFTVYTIETARMLLRPPVDTATVIFDMTSFSMANMDYSPVKFMIKCFEANYPESLGAVLVHNAPWIFQSIWSIIRGWLDPVVAGKVHFTRNVDELAEFIPKSQIIKELGGDEDFEYKYPEPVAGENKPMTDHSTRETFLASRSEMVRKYEELTVDWMGGDNVTHHTGATRDELMRERNAVAERLRDNYWQLDPFLRARSLYDRDGVLGDAGKLEFYPKKEAATAPPNQVETSADDVD